MSIYLNAVTKRVCEIARTKPSHMATTLKLLEDMGAIRRVKQRHRLDVIKGAATKADIAETKWIRQIGGAVLAVLIPLWLSELISAAMPGQPCPALVRR